jgi:hypothetical protein
MQKTSALLLTLYLFTQASASAAVFEHSSSTVTPKAETVTANLASTGITIPSSFVGVSWETNDLISGLLNGASGTSLCGVAKLLGPVGVWRIGGTSQDGTVALTQSLANGFASFLSCVGSQWTPIYGLDYGVNNPTLAAAHAGYLVNAFGVSNVVFAIANEPNYSPPYTSYTAIWNSYYSAITALYPSALFEATDVSNGAPFSNIQTMVNTLTPGVSGLQFVSFHFYPAAGSYATPTQLIANTSPGPGGNGWTGLNTYSGNRVRVTETNSVEGGGFQGVSDRMTATAKVLEVEPAGKQWCFDPKATIGGAPISEGGTWAGAPYTISNGATLTLQPCGTALVQMQP